jgi:hypothetical protein
MSICTCLVTPELSSKASEASDPHETFENKTLDSLNLMVDSAKKAICNCKRLLFTVKSRFFGDQTIHFSHPSHVNDGKDILYYVRIPWFWGFESGNPNFPVGRMIFREKSSKGPIVLRVLQASAMPDFELEDGVNYMNMTCANLKVRRRIKFICN